MQGWPVLHFWKVMAHCSLTSHALSVFITAQGMLVLDVKSLNVFSLHVFKHLNTLLQSLISLSHLEYLTFKAYNARIFVKSLFPFLYQTVFVEHHR